MTKMLHTTNYRDTFIQVADDCQVETGVIPPRRAGKPTIAGLQHAMLSGKPYVYTSDDMIFATSAVGRALDAKAPKNVRQKARDAFFSKGQACMRASPLGKQFGWGVHSDEIGRIAIVPVGSEHYRKLVSDPGIKQLRAMRSKRT